MNSERIKEIQEATAYPESVSVQQALLQVWNETEQSLREELPTWGDVKRAIEFGWNLSHYSRLDTEESLLKKQHNFIQQLKSSKGVHLK